jgi:hypothetical protein
MRPRARKAAAAIVISSGVTRLPEQAQAEQTKERCRRAIDPALGDEIEAAHRRGPENSETRLYHTISFIVTMTISVAII